MCVTRGIVVCAELHLPSALGKNIKHLLENSFLKIKTTQYTQTLHLVGYFYCPFETETISNCFMNQKFDSFI